MDIGLIVLLIAICIIFRDLIVTAIITFAGVIVLVLALIGIFLCETYDKIRR